jgi:hypothetical protein
MAITRKATGKTGSSPLTDVKFSSLCTAHEAFCCGGSYANFRKRDGYWRSLGGLGAITSDVLRHRRRRASLSLFAWMCTSICLRIAERASSLQQREWRCSLIFLLSVTLKSAALEQGYERLSEGTGA